MCGCFANEGVLAGSQLFCVLYRWFECTVCSVMYTVAHMPAGHVPALIDREQRRRMKKRQWKSIAVCRISAPSMRKMHFSSFLVHWLGPGGKTLRSVMQDLFSIKSVHNAVHNPQGCTDAFTQTKEKRNEEQSNWMFILVCFRPPKTPKILSAETASIVLMIWLI